MRRIILCLFLCGACAPKTQLEKPPAEKPNSECSVDPTTKTDVFALVSTEREMWKGSYPVPPPPTCALLTKLEAELSSATKKSLFTQFSSGSHSEHLAIVENIDVSKFPYFSLLLSVHGNPDVRVFSTAKILELLTSNRSETSEMVEFRKDVFAFLYHIVTNTPQSIEGSENSTIHGIYISNVSQILELIRTGTLIPKRETLTEERLKLWGAYADQQ